MFICPLCLDYFYRLEGEICRQRLLAVQRITMETHLSFFMISHLLVIFSTNVQCWPQDAYFPFSSLVPHFSEVWKCGKV